MLFIKDNENNIFACVDYIPSRIYRYLKVISEGAFQEVLLIVWSVLVKSTTQYFF